MKQGWGGQGSFVGQSETRRTMHTSEKYRRRVTAFKTEGSGCAREKRQERRCLKAQVFALPGVQTAEARKESECPNHKGWVGHVQKLGVYP